MTRHCRAMSITCRVNCYPESVRNPLKLRRLINQALTVRLWRLSGSRLDIWAACVAQRPSLYVTGRRMGAQRGKDHEG